MTPRSIKPVLLVLTAVVFAALLPAGSGRAEPQKSLAEVQAEVDQLNAKLDAAVEAYDQARLSLAAAARRTTAAQHRAAAVARSVFAQRKSMAQVAVSAYRTGGADQFVSLVTTADPQSFLDRASALNQIANHQSDALNAMRVAQLQLTEAQAVARQQLGEQQAIAKKLQSQRDAISATLDQQQRLLGSLKAEERSRLAAAQAARQKAARERATRVRPTATYRGPASGGAAAAIRFAYAQLGKPYQWGAAGPNSYDCSGLTMASWAQGGVSLPHSSQAQYNSGPHVSQSDLQPGDLMFYGSPIHHVSLYIGGGKAIDAPHTGAYVEIVDSPFRSDYVGAVRP